MPCEAQLVFRKLTNCQRIRFNGLTMKTTADIESPPEQTFRVLLKTIGMVRRIMEPYFSQFGVSASQWGVLRVLWRADAAGESSVRVTDLSDRLLIRPPSVTTVVDRLEREGLVTREESTVDQRVKEIRLTEAGRRLVRRILDGHTAQIESVLDGLNASEQNALRSSLDRLNRHLSALGDADGETGHARKTAKKNRKVYEVD